MRHDLTRSAARIDVIRHAASRELCETALGQLRDAAVIQALDTHDELQAVPACQRTLADTLSLVGNTNPIERNSMLIEIQ